MNKRGKMDGTMKTVMIIAGIVLVGLFINQTNFLNLGSTLGFTDADDSEDSIVDQATTECSIEPSVTFEANAEWNPTASMSSVNHRVYVNDGVGSSRANGYTESSIKIGDQIDVLYGFGSSKDTVGPYYAQKVSFTVDACGDIQSKAKSTSLDEHLLRANGTISWEAFNSDSGNKNDGTGSDNETIGSGESGEFDLSFTTADRIAVSPKDGQYGVIVEFNKSMYKEATVTLGGKTGTQVPASYSLLNTDSRAVMWEFPACPTGGAMRCDVDLGRLFIEADTGENPTGGSPQTSAAAGIALGDISVCMVDQNYDIHTRTDEILGPAYTNNEGTSSGQKEGRGDCTYLKVD